MTEIGIRKVLGAHRSHLVGQFYGESIFLSLVALAVALAIVALLLPWFSTLSGKRLTLELADNWRVIAGIGIITFFTGIIAGSYPAFFLSSFKPARILQGSSRGTAKSALLRKILVVLQFALSVILIISTTIVHNQLQYVKNKDLGYNKENVLMIPIISGVKMTASFETLRNELIKNPKVLNAAVTTQNPTNVEQATIGFEWKGKNPDDQLSIHYNTVTIDYADTLGLEVISGRGHSRDNPIRPWRCCSAQSRSSEVDGPRKPP